MKKGDRPVLCLRGKIKTGALKTQASYVFFYPDHLAVCAVKQEEMKQLKKDIKAHIKETHINLLERPVYMEQGIEDYGRIISDQGEPDIPDHSECSTVLSYADIKKLIYEPQAEAVNGEMAFSLPGKMMIEYKGGAVTIYHHYEPGEMHEQQLRKFCEQKLKARFIMKTRRIS